MNEPEQEMCNIDHLPRLKLAIEVAREAGRLTLDFFRDSQLLVEIKDDQSPVTEADRNAERLIRQRISEAFPQDGILGEEFPEREGSSGYRWILDPIDGTKSFIHGVPLYGTLIGVERNGKCEIGVICIPALDECVYAQSGEGAWYLIGDRRAVPAKVSECPKLEDSLFLISELICFDEVGRREAFEELQRKSQLTRTWGDAFGYLLVATGRAEVMIDPYLSPWDAGPMLTVLTEAGGRFTDWQGNPTIHAGEAVGTNGLVHEQVLEITQRFPKKKA